MFSVQMKTSVSCTALQRTLTSSSPCPARSKMAPPALITREMSALMECVRYISCCVCAMKDMALRKEKFVPRLFPQ